MQGRLRSSSDARYKSYAYDGSIGDSRCVQQVVAIRKYRQLRSLQSSVMARRDWDGADAVTVEAVK